MIKITKNYNVNCVPGSQIYIWRPIFQMLYKNESRIALVEPDRYVKGWDISNDIFGNL